MTFSVIWVLTLSIFVVIIQWYLKRRIQQAPLRKFPGTPPFFLFGNLKWVLSLYAKKLEYHPGVYIMERIIGVALVYKKTGMHAFWFGMTPIVSVFKPEVLEVILSSNYSLEKSFEYNFLHQWLGRGLLTSTDAKWKSRRKLLTPSFHFRILENFLPVFHDQSMVLVKKLHSMAKQEYVDITPLIVLCTLDAVCETVMGVHIGAQGGSNSEYVQAIHNLGHLFNQRIVQPWLWTDFLFRLTRKGRGFAKDIKILHNFTQTVIKEKKEKLLRKKQHQLKDKENDEEFYTKERKTFMDLLLDLHIDGEHLTEGDIREEVDTFMFEGHDTTAVGITFALYCIGLNPKIQEKIQLEIDDIFSNDKERPASYDDLRNMKYLECALKESQRIFPSVPIIGRKLDEDVTYEGLTIPRGTTIHINIIALHRNSEVFPEPEIFDPERFLAQNTIERHPYAYIPFSAGPRNCIGQKFAMLEEKVIISNILRNYSIVSLDPRDRFHTKVEFTLRPAQAVKMKFIPRT
ncbi:cytochrome P450 4c3-like [Uloborus diversus]|uniref:cytochrome P450 4c3-like n=1 Tax=Uloborus diversus TaxID=327109 RepID=UPI0024099E5E|nr:cytochrome P450 4c3-like [Uloborus diversus]